MKQKVHSASRFFSAFWIWHKEQSLLTWWLMLYMMAIKLPSLSPLSLCMNDDCNYSLFFCSLLTLFLAVAKLLCTWFVKKSSPLPLKPRKGNYLRLVQRFPEEHRVLIDCVLFPCPLPLPVIFFWLLLIPFRLPVHHVMVVDLIKCLGWEGCAWHEIK